jgi:hypothetical protein
VNLQWYLDEFCYTFISKYFGDRIFYKIKIAIESIRHITKYHKINLCRYEQRLIIVIKITHLTLSSNLNLKSIHMITIRKISRVFIPILASAVLVLTSCSKDEELDAPAASPAPAKSASATAALFSGKCFNITNFVDEGANETNDYNNIVFAFGTNNILTATSGQATATGSWNTTFNNTTGVARLIVQFQNVPGILLELNEDWVVVSSANGVVNLQDVDGGFTNLLQFTEVSCNGGGGGTGSNLSAFTNTLTTDNWKASQFIINNVNRLNQLNNVIFSFNNNGVLTLQRNNQSRSGNFSTLVDDGVLVVDITGFQNPPAGIQALNEDWKVISWTANQIQLQDPFDNGNPKSFLTLIRP